MTTLKPIYWNFDKLDVAFQGIVQQAMLDALEQARLQAQASRSQEALEWRGEKMHVAGHGAPGGYAYLCDTGPVGAKWFFSRNQSVSGWNIRVSVKSNALASMGLGRVRAEIYRYLDAIGAKVFSEAISRVDYCMDLVASEIEAASGEPFALNPTAFVMHSHTSRADHEVETKQSHGISGRYTSVTCGKMPGRQVIVYDKSKEVQERQKPEWWKHWNAAIEANGGTPLVGNERIWRVELRAGKRHLKDRWGITTWAELDNKLGDVLSCAAEQIRYTRPSPSDTQRFRWPNHPLWDAVQATIAADLAEMTSGAKPGVVKEIHRQQLLAVMERQLLGQVPTLIEAKGAPTDAESVTSIVSHLVRDHLENEPERFHAAIARSRKKYILLSDEQGQRLRRPTTILCGTPAGSGN
ncbi:hypothetical protein [Ferrovibrio sp.]|uniref:hypothetical protein n=1 Tax=Ferrovibrio sp. TaxID=1917215 RepID=UPI00351738FE